MNDKAKNVLMPIFLALSFLRYIARVVSAPSHFSKMVEMMVLMMMMMMMKTRAAAAVTRQLRDE